MNSVCGGTGNDNPRSAESKLPGSHRTMLRGTYGNYNPHKAILPQFNLESGGGRPHMGHLDLRVIQLLVPLPPSLTVMDYLSEENSNVVAENSI